MREELTKAYNEIDANHNGKISAKEIERSLVANYKKAGKPVDEAKLKAEVQEFIKAVDQNNDGRIQLNEFIDFFVKNMPT
jgi:Ca2+-binding EF-hand superfamily protein